MRKAPSVRPADIRRRTLGFIAFALALWLVAPGARAQECFQENQCTFEKPNVLVVMDYSSSMVQQRFGTQTRWQAQLAAARALAADPTFTGDLHIALARFGHDPGAAAGTTLPGDVSSPPIRDGFAVDVPFDRPDGTYVDCNAEGFQAAIDALPPPPNGQNLVGTWTRGALESARSLIQKTRANHPGDQNRTYDVVLMTDGDWNCKDSFNQASCDGGPGERDDHPAPAAAALLAAGVHVHVVAFGDGTTSADLDAIAASGGTGAALDAASPDELTSALNGIIKAVRDAVVVPQCIGGLPRVMIIMDASPSMIVGSAPGESNWDKARYALAGNPDAKSPGDPGYVKPLFDRTVQVAGHAVAIEDVVHIGLLAFNARDMQKVMLEYAPCARDNIEWAMDPYTSCLPPGCQDPYTDPDTGLVFTSLVSDRARNPPFVQTTTSLMPPCNPGGPGRCMGLVYSTYTGEGINAARVNLARYIADSGAFQIDPDAPFVNILVTDGQTSPDDPVDAVPLLADLRSSGVPTYVIGFGAPSVLDIAELDTYAAAGGTGKAFEVDPTQGGSADALAARIAQVISGLDIDPCCQLNDCSKDPEPPLPFCGNAIVDPGEACDLGKLNGALGGTCSASCAAKTYCGDGVTNGAELCDDANTNDADGCTAACVPTGFTGAGGRGSSGGGASAGAASGSGASPGAGASGNAGTSGFGGATGSGASGSGASGTGAQRGTGASVNGSGTGANGTSSGSELDGGTGASGDGGGARGNGAAHSVDAAACGCRLSAGRDPAGSLGAAALALALSAARRRKRHGEAAGSTHTKKLPSAGYR